MGAGMTPVEFLARIQRPAMAFVATLDARLDTREANGLLLPIAGIESEWSSRRQLGGPARSFWQVEPNGVLAVLQNINTQRLMIAAARALCVGIDRASIYVAIEHNDFLACIVARLLLWADPAPLPAIGDQDGAWACYLRCWRPGKPRPQDWPEIYAAACEALA